MRVDFFFWEEGEATEFFFHFHFQIKTCKSSVEQCCSKVTVDFFNLFYLML